MTIQEQLEAARIAAKVTVYRISRDTGLAYMTVRGVFDGGNCRLSSLQLVAERLGYRPVLMATESMLAKRLEGLRL